MDLQAEKAFRKRLQRDRWQKALGILTESYDEWGKGDEGEEMLLVILAGEIIVADVYLALDY